MKNSEKITDRDLAGMKELQSVAGKDFGGGVILCNTPLVIPYDKNISLVPFSSLWSTG